MNQKTLQPNFEGWANSQIKLSTGVSLNEHYSDMMTVSLWLERELLESCGLPENEAEKRHKQECC